MKVFFKNVLLCCVVSSLLIIGLCNQSLAATLRTDVNGQLMGADEVEVNGLFYSVDFLDGMADDFYGTTGSYDIAASTVQDGIDFGFALMNQVFVDGSVLWDSIPDMTNGIDANQSTAYIMTLYGDPYERGSLTGYYFINKEDNDSVTRFNTLWDYNTVTVANHVYALWAPSTSPVPLPNTLLLLGSGILGLAAGISRKKK